MEKWMAGEQDGEDGAKPGWLAVEPREALAGTSFALADGSAETGFGALWGRGAVSSFDGRAGALALSGEVVSAMLGADWMRDRWSAGVVVSHSLGEGSYSGTQARSGAGPRGAVEAELTGVHPWVRHALSAQLEVWSVAGYGAGVLELSPTRSGTGARADLDLAMVAGGLRGTVLDGGDEGFALAVKGDGLVVRTSAGWGAGPNGDRPAPSRATETRLRFGLEASRPVTLGSRAGAGAVLTPGLEVGVRHDGGDAQTGFGLDLGAGLALSAPGLGLEGSLHGRGLLSHESKDFRERGLSGSLAWSRHPGSDRGAKLTLSQTVGGSSSGGAGGLLARPTLAGLSDEEGDGGDDRASRRLEVGLGYGIGALGGRFTLTPEACAEVARTGRDYRVGILLSLRGGGGFDLSLEARRRESADDAPPAHAVRLRLDARW